MLLARRPRSDGALWPELARAFGADGLTALVLGELDMRAIHDLLAAQLNHPISRPCCAASTRSPAGTRCTRSRSRARRRRARTRRCTSFRSRGRSPTRWLSGSDRLDPRATDPLLVAAALSNPTITSIQAVIADFALSDLDSAERAGVIEIAGDRVRFTHPLLASTHYSRAPGRRRRELHRLLAELVATRRSAPTTSRSAPRQPIADRGHARARRGARDRAGCARGRSRVAGAGMSADAGRRRARHFARGPSPPRSSIGSRATADRRASCSRALLADLPSGPIRARALKQLAVTRSDDFEVATALYEEALVEAGDHHRVAAEIEGLLRRYGQTAGISHRARARSAAVRRAEQAGDEALLCGSSRRTGRRRVLPR